MTSDAPEIDKLLLLSPTPAIFTGIGGHELQEILTACQVRKIEARQIILRSGAPGEHFFLLKSGRAKLYSSTRDGKEVLLAQIERGQTFGLVTLLAPPMPYLATAETMLDSELLVWEQNTIRRLALKYPQIAQNALTIALQYLRDFSDRLVDLVSATASQRLAHAVIHMSQGSGKVTPRGVEIETTNENLAALADISIFTASRLLSAWARDGALTKTRGKIFIQSPEKLIEK